eukprot:PITA_36671
MFLLHKRLKHIKLRLKDWNTNDFVNIFVDKKSMENKIQELNQALIMEGFDKDKSDQIDKHHQQWENLCKQEEIFWRQKSRVQWLKEGEHNTRFFHRSTMANRAHNRISSIKDEDGELQISHKDIKVVLVQYFHDITCENDSDRELYIREVTRHIPKLVSRKDNFNINRPVTEEEVNEDILNVVEDSRVNRTILKVLNTSFISLIPKQVSTQTADKYKPIAL